MKTALALLFTVTSLLVGTNARACCDDGWIAYQNHCYHIGYWKLLTFAEAQDYCQNLSAYLVRLETLAENHFLKDLLNKTQAGNAWMGLTDQEHEGIWIWIDTGIQATFSDWGPGEPNNYQGQNEECVYFYGAKKYKWNDALCLHKAVPLCEKE